MRKSPKSMWHVSFDFNVQVMWPDSDDEVKRVLQSFSYANQFLIIINNRKSEVSNA